MTCEMIAVLYEMILVVHSCTTRWTSFSRSWLYFLVYVRFIEGCEESMKKLFIVVSSCWSRRMFECIIDEADRSIRERERERCGVSRRWKTGWGQDGEKKIQLPVCSPWQKSLKMVHWETCKARDGRGWRSCARFTCSDSKDSVLDFKFWKRMEVTQIFWWLSCLWSVLATYENVSSAGEKVKRTVCWVETLVIVPRRYKQLSQWF